MTIPYITNYVNLTRTTTESQAQIEVTSGSITDGAYGITFMYNADGSEAYNSEGRVLNNYNSAKIIIRRDLSMSEVRLVSMHEFGHALGLSHAWCQEYNSIMWPAQDHMATGMNDYDKNTLRHLYC